MVLLQLYDYLELFVTRGEFRTHFCFLSHRKFMTSAVENDVKTIPFYIFYCYACFFYYISFFTQPFDLKFCFFAHISAILRLTQSFEYILKACLI